MSFVKTNFLALTKKQYLYKLKSNQNAFFIIIALQVFVTLALSSPQTYGSGTTSGITSVNLSIHVVSNMACFIVTLYVLAILSIIYHNKEYRNRAFTFVSTRKTDEVSTILFYITLAAYAGITAFLNSYFSYIYTYFHFGAENILFADSALTALAFGRGLIASVLYAILIICPFYYASCMFQRSKAEFIFYMFFLGLFIFKFKFLQTIFEFYVMENNFWIFLIKAVLTIVLFLYSVVLIMSKLEVRQ